MWLLWGTAFFGQNNVNLLTKMDNKKQNPPEIRKNYGIFRKNYECTIRAPSSRDVVNGKLTLNIFW